MADKTIFEKIIDREIPADILHEDDHCVALMDINPQAPVHLLVVPKQRIPRIAEAQVAELPILGHLLLIAGELGRNNCPSGFRIVINNGPAGGETVPHLHVHILGGRDLTWPPG